MKNQMEGNAYGGPGLYRAKHVHALSENRHLDGGWTDGFLSDKNHISLAETGADVMVDEKTMCQFTGKRDRNGRKVFGGDIIKYHFNISVVGIVKYGEYRNPFNDDEHAGHVGFYVEWPGRSNLRKDLGYWLKVSEVSGNVFDNPELLPKNEEQQTQESQ